MVDLRIAPLWRRLVAALIDQLAALVVMIGAIAAGFGTHAAYQRLRGRRDPVAAETSKPRRTFEPSAARRFASWLVGAGLGVLSRNWRGPGSRLLGLRRVDAHTGGPISVRSALVDEVLFAAWGAVTRPLLPSRVKRDRDRLVALRPQEKELERKYADDPQRRQRALLDFYKSNGVDPFKVWGVALLPGMLRSWLPAVWPGGQRIRDRLTGTVVVIDP